MSTLIALAAALCTSPTVHDGDTIRCGSERIRVMDIDAPELPGSPRCTAQSRKRLANTRHPAWCDYRLGEESRDALSDFLSSGKPLIHRSGKDRYGRTLATITVNGQNAGDYLISKGLARRW